MDESISNKMIQPFPYDGLKKLTSMEAQCLTQMVRALPAPGFEPGIANGVSKVLQKYLGGQISFRYESFFETEFSKFVEGLPDPFLVAVVSLTPNPQKIIIELDLDMACLLVDRLLGGGPSKRFTPLQQAGLEFLIVRVLHELDGLLESGGRVKLQKLYKQSKGLSDLLPQNQKMVLLTFRLQFEKTTGYLRFALSKDMDFQSNALFDSPSYGLERLNSFGGLKTILWAQVGLAELSSDEMANLERGDILFLDESYPIFNGKQLTGEVHLKIGNEEGGFVAHLLKGKERLRMRLTEVI